MIKTMIDHTSNFQVYYYIPAAPPERRNPGGAIHQAYKRLRTASRERQKREQIHQEKLDQNDGKSEDDASVSEAIKWLDLNDAPWDLVLQKWIKTSKRRFTDIKQLRGNDIFKKYRHYATNYGFQLIDEDFRSMGFQEGIRGWPKIISKLRPIFVLKVKDQYSLSVLEHMIRADTSEDTQICCFMVLLNCCVQPCKTTKTFKPAILTAQQDILLFAPNIDEARVVIQDLFEAYHDHKIPPYPKIVIIGRDFQSFSNNFHVVYYQVEYHVNSLARAVDIVIKMCNIFQIPFSKITKLVWYSIQEILYDIRSPAQYKDVENIKKICQ
ncbi:uncharacterized protein LOC134214933 isoform X2 [Armigeres subalbatus]|uniref:uncharacterized protein LOC134214933 isoform X2 n=1 Tax=Armigeres subalbatus TaxID=124917 RepID=UPI002ED4F5BF